MSITIGADPELFLLDANEAYIAACGRIGGTKAEPMPLEIGNGFAVQEDNVALEYNIPPAHSREQLVNHINRAMSHLSDMIGKNGWHFASTSAVSFPRSELLHPAAQEFGCDPDFDAWNEGRANPRPQVKDKTFRTCGGHIHIGGVELNTLDDVISLVKYADLFLGVGSVLLDKDTKRRELYGKRGAYRVKPYGVEYRSLSNFWTFDPKLVAWVWDAASAAVDAWQNKIINVDDLRQDIGAAMNKGDKAVAALLVQQLQLPMPTNA